MCRAIPLLIVLAVATTASAKSKHPAKKQSRAAATTAASAAKPAGTVTVHEEVPDDIKYAILRLVNTIRSGDKAKAAAIAAPNTDPIEFWQQAGHLHTMQFHLWYDKKTKTATLSDGGMYSCAVEQAKGRWLLNHCMFNDGG